MLYYIFPFINILYVYNNNYFPLLFDYNKTAVYSYIFSTINSLYIAKTLYDYYYLDINNWYIQTCILVTYFLCDLKIILFTDYFKKIRKEYLIHHGIGIISCILYLLNYISNENLIAQFYLVELTNIPFNLTWLLIKYDKEKYKKEINLLKIITGISYFILRICNLTCLTYKVKNNFLFIPTLTITGLNYNWFLKMIF